MSVSVERYRLRDEQERVQKKTFTNWINTYLVQCSPPTRIQDLFAEIKDGLKLLMLLEVLSGECLPKESRKSQRVHSLSNVRTALSFLESKHIKLVNINPADIVDGKPTIVLGLIWTIILYFQVKRPYAQIEEQEDTILKSLEGSDAADKSEKFKGSAKRALLAWAQNSLSEKYSISIKDFGGSWRDGYAFSAIVHNINPHLIDIDAARRRSNRENLEAAFSAAETGLNIPRLLDPEDVDVDKPDEKSIMTYVAQFLKAFPDGAKKQPKLLQQVEAAKHAAEQERRELRQILEFCDAVDTAGDKDFEALSRLDSQRQHLQQSVTSLTARRQEGHLVSLLPAELDKAIRRWLAAVDFIAEARPRLAAQQDAELGDVISWLAEAEACLAAPLPAVGLDVAAGEQLTQSAVAAAGAQLRSLAERHESIFQEMPRVAKQLRDANRRSLAPSDLMLQLQQRLDAVGGGEAGRLARLRLLEAKCRCAGSLLAAQRVVSKARRGSCASRQQLQELLAECEACAAADDADEDTVGEIADSIDDNDARRFAEEAHRRLQELRQEAAGASEWLGEALAAWDSFGENERELGEWLAEAEAALQQQQQQLPDEEALSDAESRLRACSEAAASLAATLSDTSPAVGELRQREQQLRLRWQPIADKLRAATRQQQQQRSSSAFSEASERLCDWLQSAESLVDGREVEWKASAIRRSVAQLQEAQQQQEPMEAEFKAASSSAEALVRDLPEGGVKELLAKLRTVKERLQQLRRQLPERGRDLQLALPQADAFEAELSDLVGWMQAGELMLAPDAAGSSEEERRNHFGQSQQRRSQLESLSLTLQRCGNSEKNAQLFCTRAAQQRLAELTARFNELQQAEQQHTEAIRLQQEAEQWLRSANQRVDSLEAACWPAEDLAVIRQLMEQRQQLVDDINGEGQRRVAAAGEAVQQLQQRQQRILELTRDLQGLGDRAEALKAMLHRAERAAMMRLSLEERLEAWLELIANCNAKCCADAAADAADAAADAADAAADAEKLNEMQVQIQEAEAEAADLLAEEEAQSSSSSSTRQLLDRIRSAAASASAAEQLQRLAADLDNAEARLRDLESGGGDDDDDHSGFQARHRLAEQLANEVALLADRQRSLGAGDSRRIESRVASTLKRLSATRQQLETGADCERLVQEAAELLDACQEKLRAMSEPPTDAGDKATKRRLVEARAAAGDAGEAAGRLLAAEEQLLKVKDEQRQQQRLRQRLQQQQRRQQAASDNCASVIGDCEAELRNQLQLQQALADFKDWVAGLNERLAELRGDCGGGSGRLRERILQLEELTQSQKQGSSRLSSLEALAAAVEQRSSEHDAESLASDLEAARDSWHRVCEQQRQLAELLEARAAKWRRFEEVMQLSQERLRRGEAALTSESSLGDASDALDSQEAVDTFAELSASAADVAADDGEGHVIEQQVEQLAHQRELLLLL